MFQHISTRLGGVKDERYRELLLAWPARHVHLCADHIDDRTGFEGLHKMENRAGLQETEKSLWKTLIRDKCPDGTFRGHSGASRRG